MIKITIENTENNMSITRSYEDDLDFNAELKVREMIELVSPVIEGEVPF